jgi:hypothetical protein
MADTRAACVPAHVLDAVRERYLGIFASEAATILGRNRRLFPRVAAAAKIRTRTLPGTRTKSSRPDVEAVARTSVARRGDGAAALPPAPAAQPLRGGERATDG